MAPLSPPPTGPQPVRGHPVTTNGGQPWSTAGAEVSDWLEGLPQVSATPVGERAQVIVRATHLEGLVYLGTMTARAARFLDAAVASGLNVLVAGGTQAGKPALHKYTHWRCCGGRR